MKKRHIAAAFLILLIAGKVWLFIYEPAYRGPLSPSGNLQVFVHRGYGTEAPDNSLVGARLAMEAGFSGVDVDAQLTGDGEVVIFHDVTVDRFTTGTGRVDAHTLAQLQQYDLGAKYASGTTFAGERIATFADFVDVVIPHGYLMTELKVATARDTGIEQKVIDVLAQRDAFDRVYISSFNPVVIARLERLDPRVHTVFIFQDSGWDPARVAATSESDRVALPWYLQTEWTRRAIRKIIKPDALSINERVDADTITTLQNAGWPIFLWSLNTVPSLQWGMEHPGTVIITDEPTLATTTLHTVGN